MANPFQANNEAWSVRLRFLIQNPVSTRHTCAQILSKTFKSTQSQTHSHTCISSHTHITSHTHHFTHTHTHHLTHTHITSHTYISSQTHTYTHSQFLGVPPSEATFKLVRKAYLKKALRMHPDKDASAGATERFKALGEAYALALTKLSSSR